MWGYIKIILYYNNLVLKVNPLYLFFCQYMLCQNYFQAFCKWRKSSSSNLDYHLEDHEQAEWVYYKLNSLLNKGIVDRSDKFRGTLQ